MDIREYVTEDGKVPFRDWLYGLRDRVARARIRIRLDRVRLGNLGDYRQLNGGLYELRIAFGPGYRVYFAMMDQAVVLLLAGGDKGNAKTSPRLAPIGMISERNDMAKTRDYQEDLLEALQDPEEAAEYLNAALEDDDREVFLLALRNVAQARVGGMANLAEATGLNRESLYKMLSEQGNPELNSLSLVLHALGLKFSVGVDDHAA